MYNNTRYNQHQNQYAQNSHINNNPNFLQNWPTPEENTMNIQQTLSSIMGSIEKVGARVDNIEMRQMNNWNL